MYEILHLYLRPFPIAIERRPTIGHIEQLAWCDSHIFRGRINVSVSEWMVSFVYDMIVRAADSINHPAIRGIAGTLSATKIATIYASQA